MLGCLALQTLTKRLTADSGISRVARVHRSIWQEMCGVWHTSLTFISRSHILVRSTLHASTSIREFYLCPDARTSDKREGDLTTGSKKHT